MLAYHINFFQKKKTFTGLHTNYFKFTSFNYKVGLVRTLVDRVYKINSSWGVFAITSGSYPHFGKSLLPLSVINNIVNLYLSKKQSHVERTDNAQERQSVSLHYFKLPYVGSFSLKPPKGQVNPSNVIVRLALSLRSKSATCSLC